MTTESYIERKAGNSNTGKRLYLNVVSVRTQKGQDTIDVPVPTGNAENRLLFPLSGEKHDITISFHIIQEDVNVSRNVNSNGSTTAVDEVKSIAEQSNYLENNIFTHGVGIIHKLHLDYFDKTIEGLGTLSLNADENFSGLLTGEIQIKVGLNILQSFN